MIAGFRPDWADVAMVVWIGSQIASAMAIVVGAGDKRAAIYVAWEWFGVGLTWIILRHALREDEFRRSLIRAAIVSGALMGGLGLFQHYVSNPQIVAEYGPLFDQLRAGTPGEANSARQKLINASIPTEGPALTLFEKRLRDSHEPVGLFALANTLGGCLAVCLVLAIGQVFAITRIGTGWKRFLPLLTSIGVMGWCLLLTKSRTAWIGTMAGVAILVAPRFDLAARYRKFILAGLVVVTFMTAVLARFGGLDLQVVSEAPKSLAYRLQYWQATSRLIADHPWFGVGPGNFRQQYLKYKLPEASEEIADPHNMFFEVAATGGIPSLAGMALFLTLVVAASRYSGRGASTGELSDQAPSPPESTSIGVWNSGMGPAARRAFWFAGLGAPVAFASLLGFAGEWEDRLLVITAVWFAIAFWFDRTDSKSFDKSNRDSRTAFAAFVALCVHLLGAGGIGMPGVSQWLIAMGAISMGIERRSAASIGFA